MHRVGVLLTVRYTGWFFFNHRPCYRQRCDCFACLTFGCRGCISYRGVVRNSYHQDSVRI